MLALKGREACLEELLTSESHQKVKRRHPRGKRNAEEQNGLSNLYEYQDQGHLDGISLCEFSYLCKSLLFVPKEIKKGKEAFPG